MYHFHSYWFDRFKDLKKVDKKNPFWYNKEKGEPYGYNTKNVCRGYITRIN